MDRGSGNAIAIDSYRDTDQIDRIAVIIPCYKVTDHIEGVIEKVGPEVDAIFTVDDCCPNKSGEFIEQNISDERVTVLYNERNLGVGGAVKHGLTVAAQRGFTYLVKVDGDGQMDPAEISKLIAPIKDGRADFTKANRFFSPRSLTGMPAIRIFGNGVLSFMTKLSSGYWHIMDPTNGYVAIHAKAFRMLETEKIDNRFFFETDLLCRLHLINAVVEDVPIPAIYGDEESNLKISRVIFDFSAKHFSRTCRRVVYDYFVRDFNIGSAQLIFGAMLFLFGTVFGLYHWIMGNIYDIPTETGTIMIAILPTLIGFQLLLSALNFDISRRTTSPLHKLT